MRLGGRLGIFLSSRTVNSLAMLLCNLTLEKQLLLLVFLLIIPILRAEDPSLSLVWKVTSITSSPLGVPQKVIAINGQFPGPVLHATTNWNLIINVFNDLEEPFLLTWNGVQLRHNSWQDGVPGTNCPILPGRNWTYRFQAKDQIGSFFYSPSALFQRAGGGFGSIRLDNRVPIPVPFPPPADDVPLMIGDWYNTPYTLLRAALDAGKPLRKPDGVLINGKGSPGHGSYTTITVEPGSTIRLRISNVGTSTSLNFRIEGHQLLLVEAEGSYTKQVLYDHLDIHVGQSYSVLVTANQSPRDYSIVASGRFVDPVISGVAMLHYSNSQQSASGPLPAGPKPLDIQSSLKQARSIRWNLKAGAARPNPQGSFHYGSIKVAKTFVFANSAPVINGRQRYAVNDVSFVVPDTAIKLADFFKIGGVFQLSGIPETPSGWNPTLGTPVLSGDYRAFVEIVFQNNENDIQSWHIDGYAFFVVGFDLGSWSSIDRKSYNLKNAVARSTTQVYPGAWTAVLVELDNVGLWNVRSQTLHRQYLGQEFYLRVYDPAKSLRSEYAPPDNVLLCGAAKKRK